MVVYACNPRQAAVPNTELWGKLDKNLKTEQNKQMPDPIFFFFFFGGKELASELFYDSLAYANTDKACKTWSV